MDKLSVRTVEMEQKVHKFFCDDCGKYLGRSEELDDGYYESFGNFGVSFLFNEWYEFEANLCDECKKKKTDAIYKALYDLGFKPTRDAILNDKKHHIPKMFLENN